MPVFLSSGVSLLLFILILGKVSSDSTNKIDEDEEVFATSSSGEILKNSAKHKMHKDKAVVRRSSVAALRRDSCKVS